MAQFLGKNWVRHMHCDTLLPLTRPANGTGEEACVMPSSLIILMLV